jgi:hypothetical protein
MGCAHCNVQRLCPAQMQAADGKGAGGNGCDHWASFLRIRGLLRLAGGSDEVLLAGNREPEWEQLEETLPSQPIDEEDRRALKETIQRFRADLAEADAQDASKRVGSFPKPFNQSALRIEDMFDDEYWEEIGEEKRNMLRKVSDRRGSESGVAQPSA